MLAWLALCWLFSIARRGGAACHHHVGCAAFGTAARVYYLWVPDARTPLPAPAPACGARARRGGWSAPPAHAAAVPSSSGAAACCPWRLVVCCGRWPPRCRRKPRRSCRSGDPGSAVGPLRSAGYSCEVQGLIASSCHSAPSAPPVIAPVRTGVIPHWHGRRPRPPSQA